MNAQTKIVPGSLVYQKIAAVQGELAKVGISKSRRNQQQGYNFRGIDEVYAALSPLLASNGLIIVPRILSRECVEGQTRKGDPLFRVTVHAEFDFIAAEDGSIHTAATFGEAMDSADKATNKAMSAAYKYAAFMTFAIPTEGDNDADASTPELANKPDVIDDAQWSELVQLIEVTNSDTQAFCKAYRIGSLKELPAAAFDRARRQLNTKLSKMKETENA